MQYIYRGIKKKAKDFQAKREMWLNVIRGQTSNLMWLNVIGGQNGKIKTIETFSLQGLQYNILNSRRV